MVPFPATVLVNSTGRDIEAVGNNHMLNRGKYLIPILFRREMKPTMVASPKCFVVHSKKNTETRNIV